MDDLYHQILQRAAAPPVNPYNHNVAFGPSANCTLDICPPQQSVYGYIPDLASNTVFLAMFAAAMLVHAVIGLMWNQWWFTCCMVAGCVDEILGYAGRVWMSQDLWNFQAFMIQVGEFGNSWVLVTSVLAETSLTCCFGKSVLRPRPSSSALPSTSCSPKRKCPPPHASLPKTRGGD